MKHFTLLGAILVIALLLAACGSAAPQRSSNYCADNKADGSCSHRVARGN
jgi:hypothetical protein